MLPPSPPLHHLQAARRDPDVLMVKEPRKQVRVHLQDEPRLMPLAPVEQGQEEGYSFEEGGDSGLAEGLQEGGVGRVRAEVDGGGLEGQS